MKGQNTEYVKQLQMAVENIKKIIFLPVKTRYAFFIKSFGGLYT